jgi:hypothetical protein
MLALWLCAVFGIRGITFRKGLTSTVLTRGTASRPSRQRLRSGANCRDRRIGATVEYNRQRSAKSSRSTVEISFRMREQKGKAHMNAADETPHPMHDPIALALYSFAFRTGPEARHLTDAVNALSKNVPPEVVCRSLAAIRGELEKPVQVIASLLPGSMKSEEECRGFLRLVVGRMNV